MCGNFKCATLLLLFSVLMFYVPPLMAEQGLADLHVHTLYSDGVLTPAAVVEMAKNSKMSAIAITDHDSIAAIDEAIRAGESLGVTIVPGIEFGAYAKDTEIHILGYFIDYKNPEFIKALEHLKTFRVKRIEGMIAKLNRAGFDIKIDEVFKEAAGTSGVEFDRLSIGRAHLSKVMTRKKICKDERDAMENFIGLGNPYYVDVMNNLSPVDAIKLIKKYNGVPVVAHPGLIKQKGLVEELIKNGLCGIEAIYPKHSAEQTRAFEKIAIDNKLEVTGGSDFHTTPGIIGEISVPMVRINDLQKIRIK